MAEGTPPAVRLALYGYMADTNMIPAGRNTREGTQKRNNDEDW